MKDPNRRRYPVAERLVEVIDDRQTGETILDEALKMMKAQESDRMGINSWIDLLSGTYPYSVVFPFQISHCCILSNVRFFGSPYSFYGFIMHMHTHRRLLLPSFLPQLYD